MERYAKWLKKNEVSLQEMLELSDEYDEKESDETIKEYIKTRVWYKENKTINQCLEEMEEGDQDIEQSISLTKRILDLREEVLNLYTSKGDKAGITKTEKEIVNSKDELTSHLESKKIRPKVKFFLKNFEPNSLVQDLIK
jgi:DNA-binding transcriptional MerR regulator